MNICMLVYNYHPNITGGAEKQCRLQAQELVSRGHSCTILTARTKGELPRVESDGRCDIVRLTIVQPLIDGLLHLKRGFSRVGGRGALEAPRAKKEQKAARPTGLAEMAVHWLNALFFMVLASCYLVWHRKSIDVLHTHIASWNAGFAGWIGYRLGIPVVCKASFLPVFDKIKFSVPFSGTLRTWRKRLTYIALTGEMVDDLCKEGVPRDAIHTVPNGVVVPEKVTSVRESLLVLYIGNLSQGAKHKSFDILLKAWAEVCAENEDILLSIAGGGDVGPWKQMAWDLGCGESVRFEGHVKDISRLLAKAALFVLPSRGEGISNALLEAQSCGIPAVVTDIPGNTEVVLHGETGIVVPVDDVSGLSEAILKLMADDDTRERMGAEARQHIIEKYSIRSVVDRVCNVYEEMSTGRASRSLV